MASKSKSAIEAEQRAIAAIDNMDELSAIADTIDQNTIERPTQAFPLLQWVNGSSNQKKIGGVAYTGGWFISQQSAGSLEELTGWVKDTLITRNGTEVPGFFKRDVEIAFLHMRRHWRVVNEGDKAVFYPWNQYNDALDASSKGKKPAGNVQVLVWVKGLDILNPMVLTVKGYVSAELTGSRNNEGVFGAFSTRVVGTINKALHAGGNKKSLPWRAFWMPVGPQRDEKGLPVYTTVGQGTATSQVTLPALIGIVKHPTAAEVRPLFIGKAMLDQLNVLWAEARCQDWAAAWDTVSQEQEVVASESSTKPRITNSDMDGALSGAADLGDGPIDI